MRFSILVFSSFSLDLGLGLSPPSLVQKKFPPPTVVRKSSVFTGALPTKFSSFTFYMAEDDDSFDNENSNDVKSDWFADFNPSDYMDMTNDILEDGEETKGGSVRKETSNREEAKTTNIRETHPVTIAMSMKLLLTTCYSNVLKQNHAVILTPQI